MSDTAQRIEELNTRLENLIKTQIDFQREVNRIRYELGVLRSAEQKRAAQTPPRPKPPVREPLPKTEPPRESPRPQTPPHTEAPRVEYAASSRQAAYESQAPESSSIEKFIGENLISKIGIIILILGVAIGTKYAIDNNLISPLARIILGYIFGFVLLALAVYLKPRYHNFSAVLLSGAMAIMYFVTYFAYSSYDLIGQSAAFALMLIFTVFTIGSAIAYNRQVIAHIGLVGAYAIPFLLSDDSGKYVFLFSYVALLDLGILAISLKKYWRSLFYTAFGFTWLIFAAWHVSKYDHSLHFSLAWTFLTAFFLIFYLIFLAYKVRLLIHFTAENVALILANSFIFYGFGYSLLDGVARWDAYLGLFTVMNAFIHFAFAFAVSRIEKIPEDITYLLGALVLTFATLAIPVQLDGNWVTLAWSVEAAILFCIGRIKQISLYEYFSYLLMMLASFSLLLDWQARMWDNMGQTFAFLNGTFVTTLMYAAAFGVIYFVNREEQYEPAIDEAFRQPLSYLIGALALGSLYNAFRMQISDYFYYRAAQTAIDAEMTSRGGHPELTDGSLRSFSIIWQINYTMLFLTILGFFNMKKLRDIILAFANIAANAFTLFLFITLGTYLLSELRENYLLQTNAEFFDRGVFHIAIRYVSYLFVAGLLYSCWRYARAEFLREVIPSGVMEVLFDLGLHIVLLCIASSELVNWMEILGYPDAFKFGLSILWGIYALALVILGIYLHRMHLRISAIVLFGITLVKLFFYDIAELDTISKTIVFVALGILLLIVSFLYAKYRNAIFGPSGNSD